MGEQIGGDMNQFVQAFESDDFGCNSLAEYLHVEVLGFCGCGMPEESMSYIEGGLRLIDDLTRIVWTHKCTFAEWKDRTKEFFGSDAAEYFFYYWADKEGLTEHGGSVPGWLDDKGRALLEAIDIARSRRGGDG